MLAVLFRDYHADDHDDDDDDDDDEGIPPLLLPLPYGSAFMSSQKSRYLNNCWCADLDSEFVCTLKARDTQRQFPRATDKHKKEMHYYNFVHLLLSAF